jgi:hypothetical protein
MANHASLLYNLGYTSDVCSAALDRVCVNWLPRFRETSPIKGQLLPLFNDCSGYLMTSAAFIQG